MIEYPISMNQYIEQINEVYRKLYIARYIDNSNNEDIDISIVVSDTIKSHKFKNIEQYWTWLNQAYKDIDHARNLDNQEFFRINLNKNIWLFDALKRLMVINKITNEINQNFTDIQELIDLYSGRDPHTPNDNEGF